MGTLHYDWKVTEIRKYKKAMELIRRYEEVLRIEFGEDMPGVNWEAVVTNAIKNKQGAHRHTLAKRKTPEGLANDRMLAGPTALARAEAVLPPQKKPYGSPLDTVSHETHDMFKPG